MSGVLLTEWNALRLVKRGDAKRGKSKLMEGERMRERKREREQERARDGVASII